MKKSNLEFDNIQRDNIKDDNIFHNFRNNEKV